MCIYEPEWLGVLEPVVEWGTARLTAEQIQPGSKECHPLPGRRNGHQVRRWGWICLPIILKSLSLTAVPSPRHARWKGKTNNSTSWALRSSPMWPWSRRTMSTTQWPTQRGQPQPTCRASKQTRASSGWMETSSERTRTVRTFFATESTRCSRMQSQVVST